MRGSLDHCSVNIDYFGGHRGGDKESVREKERQTERQKGR